MLHISKFKCLWARLPSNQLLDSGSFLIHLYPTLPSAYKLQSDLSMRFQSDSAVKNIIDENRIGCFSQEAQRIHPSFLQRLEVKTVPVIIALHNGENMGHFTIDSDDASALALCKKLLQAQLPPPNPFDDKELMSISDEIRTIIADHEKAEALNRIAELQQKHIQRLEVDDNLRRLFALETLKLYAPNYQSVKDPRKKATLSELYGLLDRVEKAIRMFKDEASDSIIRCYSSHGTACPDSLKHLRIPDIYTHLHEQPLKEVEPPSQEPVARSKGKDAMTLASELLNECMDIFNYHVIKEGSKGPQSHYERVMWIKVRLMQDISVALFFEDDVDKSLETAVQAYESLVKLLNEDIVSTEEFQRHEIGSVIEAMFGALSYDHPAVLNARASLEVVSGPRLLNAIKKGSRPLGGPAYKRRGFGGRYSWHGPDYRPKKYKPKDPQQYLNEWRYEQDCNLPTY
ncbi:hypothetical protein BgAZ_205260 [Babesia gibsoni]|uniref:Uncharacterized protein n=1 Tax=Babesia gibsoni TaxID=33632 RepID=A0AAD8LT48_BABGI|nr:hypothetical protein BgAZ_205260 [Babesia gibsoni]